MSHTFSIYFSYSSVLQWLSSQMRIMTSWALANVCDALDYSVDDSSFEGINDAIT